MVSLFLSDWDLGEPQMRIDYCEMLTGLSLVYSHKPYTLNCSKRLRRKYVYDDNYRDEYGDWDVDQDEKEDEYED